MKRKQQHPSKERKLTEENRRLKRRVEELEEEVERLNRAKDFREREDSLIKLAAQRGPHY